MTFLYDFVLLEYLFVLAIGCALCLLKFVTDKRKKKESAAVFAFKILLKEAVFGKGSQEELEEAAANLKPQILIQALESYEVFIQSEAWEKTKVRLTQKYLKGWAAEAAQSLFWSKRNLAAQAFLLAPQTSDLPHLKVLLEDKSFLIRMEAATALTQIPSRETMELLLQQMAKESALARPPFRQAILKMPFEHLLDIISIYERSDDENLRLSCLDLMSRKFIANPMKALKKDYRAPSPEIRRYIVRILGSLASDEAVNDLLLFLEDTDADVRLEAVQSLGKIRSERTFEKVQAMLHDPVYQVRLNAALALINFGKRGVRVLELQDWDIDSKAYEVARYVLTMP